jgi:hypothetical protein
VQGGQVGHDAAIHQALGMGHLTLVDQLMDYLPISGIPAYEENLGHF